MIDFNNIGIEYDYTDMGLDYDDIPQGAFYWTDDGNELTPRYITYKVGDGIDEDGEFQHDLPDIRYNKIGDYWFPWELYD